MHLPDFYRRPGSLVLCLAVFAPELAAQAPTPQTVLELPTYTVTTERELPPPERWYYAQIEGFEVLSDVSDRSTRRLVNDFQRFGYALNLIWPGMRPIGATGISLIICRQRQMFQTFLPESLLRSGRPITSFHLRTREHATIVLDCQTKILNLPEAADTPVAPAAAIGADPDSTAESADAGPNQGVAVDSYQQLYREYLRLLFAARPAPPPAWLSEGLTQLLMNLRITGTEISVGRVEDPNAKENRTTAASATDRDFNTTLARRALLPMAEMFAVTSDSDTAQNTMDSTWAKQCHAFVHWGLYGDFGRNKKAFATFVARLDREPLSETLFKECFKSNYADMLPALRTHIESTRTQFEGVRADKGGKIPFPPDAAVRPATEAEIGRLKGEVFTLASHPVAARTELVTAYRRGERAPDLLAPLGLAELAAGEQERARKFLEAAAAGKAANSRAYVELARLRLTEAEARPEATDGKLSAAQVARVLEPLRLARAQPPPLPETYELIGATWTASATPPPASHLELLKEGLRLFPRDAKLRARFEALAATPPSALTAK